jgi:hypothetical protein
MPDNRSHRGPHPEDAGLFAPSAWPRLQAAVSDYSWLLGRGYGQPSATKLVGDRYELNQRQRAAVMRSACSDAARDHRRCKQVPASALADQTLWIDGFNVLTTIEVALGGGIILAARDGCYRDIASVHGTYRKVEETRPGIQIVGQLLAQLAPRGCVWLLDSPVGNSGRLKTLLLEVAAEEHWNWKVEVVHNPDAELIVSEAIVATADSVILDRCRSWFNLAQAVISAKIAQARIIPMTANPTL